MSKPFSLFIHPPYDKDWSLVHGYGPENLPNGRKVLHHFVLLRTKTDGNIYAPTNGKLSVFPPYTANQKHPTEPFNWPESEISSKDKRVTLYLHGPLKDGPQFNKPLREKLLSIGIRHIAAFGFVNIEIASLPDALGMQLDACYVPATSGEGTQIVERWKVVEALVRGLISVPVKAGDLIGKAAPASDDPSAQRQIGFAVFTNDGTHDPSFIYDQLRDYVDDTTENINTLIDKIPKKWPLIALDETKEQALEKTKTTLFPMSTLNEIHSRYKPTFDEWRGVGDNQKDQYLARLLARSGRAPSTSNDPPFEFDSADFRNIFQLEAVVEFYANFDDPWEQSVQPRPKGHNDYITVDFLDPEGEGAVGVESVANIGTKIRLGTYFKKLAQRVKTNQVKSNRLYDTIRLENDTARRSKVYRIVEVGEMVNSQGMPESTVTVEGEPQLTGGSSRWKINLRPILVLVDSFGGRLYGRDASTNIDVVTLMDPTPKLDKVNPHFDTLYLESDITQPANSLRPARTYRISKVNDVNHTVTVMCRNDLPDLADNTSRWHIQAGISGDLPFLYYELYKFDHFDGAMFVLKDGKIHKYFRWSSMTSPYQEPQNKEWESSIRGNRLYDFYSLRAGKTHINYSFLVKDAGAPYDDGIREARFYFDLVVKPDIAPPGKLPPAWGTQGKKQVMIHWSRREPQLVNGKLKTTKNSAGCLVSPSFPLFRDVLIGLYQQEYGEFNRDPNPRSKSPRDQEVDKVFKLTQDESEKLTTNKLFKNGQQISLSPADWRDKILGRLWVIRPDERPLGQYPPNP